MQFINWRDHPLTVPQPPPHDMVRPLYIPPSILYITVVQPAAGKGDGTDIIQDTLPVTEVHYTKLLMELVQ